MKKVLLVLILFLSCYFIYQKTSDNKLYYLTFGDYLSKGVSEYGSKTYGYNEFAIDYLRKRKQLKDYNKTFTSTDYRIIDIIKILEYNEKKDDLSLNYLIKKADIITMSIGMNELNYKIFQNPSNIYTYIDDMEISYDKILSYINSFHHKKVFILGYYTKDKEKKDIINYANYKLRELCSKYDFTYINIQEILDNNPNYFTQKELFAPNLEGYQKISKIIVEKLKNNWYNILRNFITMT